MIDSRKAKEILMERVEEVVTACNIGDLDRLFAALTSGMCTDEEARRICEGKGLPEEGIRWSKIFDGRLVFPYRERTYVMVTLNSRDGLGKSYTVVDIATNRSLGGITMLGNPGPGDLVHEDWLEEAEKMGGKE